MMDKEEVIREIVKCTGLDAKYVRAQVKVAFAMASPKIFANLGRHKIRWESLISNKDYPLDNHNG